jgi:hypothetical protein
MNLRIDCYLVITLYLGTKKRTRRHIEEGLEAWRTNKGARVKMEAQTKLLRVHFGVQEQSALNWSSRSHMGSDLDVIDMYRKLTRRPFQWFLLEAQIHPELSGIVRTS